MEKKRKRKKGDREAKKFNKIEKCKIKMSKKFLKL